jgi:5-methyltetrahydrofolate--homocysteine methyltransferase
MGIVNAGQLAVYDDIDAELREAVEDVVLNRRDDATERLLELAERYRDRGEEAEEEAQEWRSWPVEKRLEYALVKGISRLRRRGRRGGAAKVRPAYRGHRGPAHGRDGCGRGPLRVGPDVLPQVVKSARVMKRASRI